MDAGHPFLERPHRTVGTLCLPVLGSLIAEPLTGLIDTAFVARLGAESLAALGAGTMVLSALFWVFSFLGVATQTRVANYLGREAGAGRAGPAAARMCLVAVCVALLVGAGTLALGLPMAGAVASMMGTKGTVAALTVDYLSWRLAAAPAMLASFAAFGALRGAQDMRTPLRVALGMNALNVVLDPLLIFGAGPVPALGVAGAAIASAVSHWFGAVWAVWAAFRRLGMPGGFDRGLAKGLLQAGVDLFLRALSLNVFLILGTRTATLIGPAAGAVHQVIRSVWFFNALFMDSFAIVAQSLVAYFLGHGEKAHARRVAKVVCQWSCGCGLAIGAAMLAGESLMLRIYIPAQAVALFPVAWRIAAASQPVSGMTFATDGIHFGAGDFRYLRNVVLAALLAGGAVILWVDVSAARALDGVWVSFLVWAGIRAVAGAARIWPGSKAAPLGSAR